MVRLGVFVARRREAARGRDERAMSARARVVIKRRRMTTSTVEDDAALARAIAALELERASASAALDDGFLRPTAREAATADDEALARRFQAEEDAKASAGPSAAAATAATSDGSRCRGCGLAIGMFEGLASVRLENGSRYHGRCFKCAECAGSMLEGSQSREFVIHGSGADARMMHKTCYMEKHKPRCSVCDVGMEADANGVIRFHIEPFWGAKSCPAHATDGTPSCDGCRRLQPRRGEEYVRLPDDRMLCAKCVSTVVVDQHDAEPLFQDIVQFFGTFGLSALGPNSTLPPLYMCTQDVMDHVDVEEAWHRGRTSQVRGMCVSHTETVDVVYREPTWTKQTRGGSMFSNLLGGGFQMVERRLPQLVTQKVSAILVLSCLPRLLCGQILAHECMHMYLKLNGFPTLEPIIEEGICQLFSLLWIEAQIAKPEISGEDVVFAAYIADVIKSDESPIYGDGARLAIAAYTDHGLVHVLDSVKRTRNLP